MWITASNNKVYIFCMCLSGCVSECVCVLVTIRQRWQKTAYQLRQQEHVGYFTYIWGGISSDHLGVALKGIPPEFHAA